MRSRNKPATDEKLAASVPYLFFDKNRPGLSEPGQCGSRYFQKDYLLLEIILKLGGGDGFPNQFLCSEKVYYGAYNGVNDSS